MRLSCGPWTAELETPGCCTCASLWALPEVLQMGSPPRWSTEGRTAQAECPPSDGHDSLIYFSDQPGRCSQSAGMGCGCPRLLPAGKHQSWGPPGPAGSKSDPHCTPPGTVLAPVGVSDQFCHLRKPQVLVYEYQGILPEFRRNKTK